MHIELHFHNLCTQFQCGVGALLRMKANYVILWNFPYQ
jgi:hypothetical protein